MATDEEAMSIDEAPSEAAAQHNHDFSGVQGLQVVGPRQGIAEDAAAEDAWREALKLELEARAARFHHAVDASIVLADDGVIRWLGDPVARLTAGADLMSPRALVLADPALSDAARDMVTTRLDLWLAATIKRLLGPLLALRSLEEESEPVRRLATRISDSLGVLEREPVKGEIRALDQNSRAALRRHGVRFGAYYIYVPQSLKPAARSLALRLWSLRASEAVGEELAKTLLQLSSSGRTSLPLDPSISKDGYRVAGFRPCGERAVRVDIVERLSDMIRAALVSCAPADGASAPGVAFLVTAQMTSLTGCSGEIFASILRSLGYESFEIEVNRLSPIRPQPATPAGPPDPAPSDAEPGAEPQPEIGRDEAAPSEESPKVPQDSRADEDAEAISPPLLQPEAALEPSDLARLDAEPAAKSDMEGGEERAAPVEHSAAVGQEQPVDGEEPEVAAEVAQSSTPAFEESPPIARTDLDEAVAAEGGSAPAGEPTEPAPESKALETSGVEPAGEPIDTKVTAWRFARRPRPERSKRRGRHGEAPGGALRRPEAGGSTPHADQERRSGGPQREAGDEAAHRKRDRSNRPGEKRHKPSPKPGKQGSSGQFEPRRAATVDPNSPFAKLLELRSALEKQAKNR